MKLVLFRPFPDSYRLSMNHYASMIEGRLRTMLSAGDSVVAEQLPEPQLQGWGRYRDQYVPDGDRWLFAHRNVRTDGTTPGGWAAGRTN